MYRSEKVDLWLFEEYTVPWCIVISMVDGAAR
jgi:hypothetical protein